MDGGLSSAPGFAHQGALRQSRRGSSRRGAAARFGVARACRAPSAGLMCGAGRAAAIRPIRDGGDGGRDGSRERGRVLAGQGGPGAAGHHTRRDAGGAERARPVGRDRHGVAVLDDRHISAACAKKNRARRRAGETPFVAARRLLARKPVPISIPRRLVFIDETGASTQDGPICAGRSKRGQRCRAGGPTWTLEATTFTAESTPGWP